MNTSSSVSTGDGFAALAGGAAFLRLTDALSENLPPLTLVDASSFSYAACSSAAASASAMNCLTSATPAALASLAAFTSTASVRYERNSFASSLRNSAGEVNTSTVATLPLIATA